MTRSVSIVLSFLVQTLKDASIPKWNQWLGALLLLLAIFLVAMQPAAKKIGETLAKRFCCCFNWQKEDSQRKNSRDQELNKRKERIGSHSGREGGKGRG